MNTVRRTLRFLAAATVTVTLAIGHDAVEPARADVDVPEFGTCPADAPLAPGDVSMSVYCLQWSLIWYRNFTGPLTGIYDQATADAVQAFQLANPPLTANGEVNAQTLIALGIYSGVEHTVQLDCVADAPVQEGDRGQSAECLQKKLAQAHLFTGKVDGSFGRDTLEAVKAFQYANPPLDTDGVADSSTLAALGIWSGFNKASQVLDTKWWPAGFQAEPNWRLVGGIPVYGNRKPCSKADADTIALEFAKDGADVETQQYFIYIASREGNCNYTAVNINPATKDDSHCTFQLNALAGMFEPNGELGRRGWTKDNVKASMAKCADAASDLWVYCARGPWIPPYSCTPPWAGDLGPEGDA